jgi:hypothetical protein
MQSSCFGTRVQAEPCNRRVLASHRFSDVFQHLGSRNVFGRPTRIAHRKASTVTAQAMGKADPPDVPKPRGQPQGGREWLQSILSRFGPVREKASNTTVLDFEKPLVELDNRIKEVRRTRFIKM